MRSATWHEFLCEYANPARRRDPQDPNHGGIACDGMALEAFRVLRRDEARDEVVRRLRDAAERRGVMDQVHVIRHSTSGVYLIPEGWTNRAIIEMIERAPK